jgi:16S rRNA processing protein RimM
VAAVDEKTVVLGRVSGLFGVTGWVKVFSYADPRDAILDYPAWLISINGEWCRYELVEGRRHGKTIIARLRGVDDRDSASALVNATIGVKRSALPEAEAGRYYWSDLEGLSVEDSAGKPLGAVAYLLETGANDVLVVRQDEREILIPFVTGEVVKGVDLAKGVISVDWEAD